VFVINKNNTNNYTYKSLWLQLGNWAFCVAGPVAWNSLPLDIRSAPTVKHAQDIFFHVLTSLTDVRRV